MAEAVAISSSDESPLIASRAAHSVSCLWLQQAQTTHENRTIQATQTAYLRNALRISHPHHRADSPRTQANRQATHRRAERRPFHVIADGVREKCKEADPRNPLGQRTRGQHHNVIPTTTHSHTHGTVALSGAPDPSHRHGSTCRRLPLVWSQPPLSRARGACTMSKRASTWGLARRRARRRKAGGRSRAVARHPIDLGASLTTYSDSHFPLLQIDDLGCLALEHVL